MEAVIFVGLQGAGKTTFYHRRFAASHKRISLDQLKTRAREMTSFRSAMANREKVVVDNTNPTIAERKKYIEAAKAAGYQVVGCYFEVDIAGCLKRNAARSGSEHIPVAGIFGTKKRLQLPSMEEGFDALFIVRIDERGEFIVQPWSPPADPAITRGAQARPDLPSDASGPKDRDGRGEGV